MLILRPEEFLFLMFLALSIVCAIPIARVLNRKNERGVLRIRNKE